MVKHLPGDPVDGVQRCERCGWLLVDYSPASGAMVASASEARALFFRPGVPIVHEGPMMATAVDPQGVDVYPEALECRLPSVEGVHVVF